MQSAVSIRYLALGDSYTIGTGASGLDANFPSRLAHKLEEATGSTVELKNPAVNGYTTTDLIVNELPELERFKPDLVTILIGVNDLVQRSDEAGYRTRLRRIYDSVARLDLPQGRVAAISIPDFSIVPAAPTFGVPSQLHARTDAFNAVARQEASACRFSFLELGDVSRAGAGRAGWIAEDNLHPGDLQYAAWADALWPHLRDGWVAAAVKSG
jgi:lysophospholipase L1-like esterase